MSKLHKVRIVRLEDVLPRFHGNAPSSQMPPSGNPIPSRPFIPAREFLSTFSLTDHLAARGEK